MLTCAFMPFPYCTLVQPKGFHDRLDWTAIGQQDDHVHHDRWITAQLVKDRTFCSDKGLLANFAKVSLFLLTMNMNVPFSSLTPCGAFHIRAKYILWVHWWLSRMSKSLEFANEPHFLQAFYQPHHALMG
jgi:hypothetical protein